MIRLRFAGNQFAWSYVIYSVYNVIAEWRENVPYGNTHMSEYIGLIMGITKCLEMGISDFDVEGDSVRVLSQMLLKEKCTQRNLIPLYENSWELVNRCSRISFHLIEKDYNSYTHSLL